MDVIDVAEAVRVQVIFEPVPLLKSGKGMAFPHHKIKPRAFVWQNREHRVEEITYVWREAIGDAMIYHFAVTEQENVFELCFNSVTMDWTLGSVARE